MHARGEGLFTASVDRGDRSMKALGASGRRSSVHRRPRMRWASRVIVSVFSVHHSPWSRMAMMRHARRSRGLRMVYA